MLRKSAKAPFNIAGRPTDNHTLPLRFLIEMLIKVKVTPSLNELTFRNLASYI